MGIFGPGGTAGAHLVLPGWPRMSARVPNAEGIVAMPGPETRSCEEFGGRLRTIARIAAGCRAALALEERQAAPRHNARQVTIGQLLVLVVLWALAAAAWRLTW
jgi:hypothetical protein